jgi:hypothetical protein
MTETETSEFLYSLPGAERAFGDPAGCYEAEIDWDENAHTRPWTIEKWTAIPASRDLPSVDHVIEWVIELAADETTEDGVKDWEHAGERDDVKAAFRAALDLLGRHVSYRLCDSKVGEHTVTFDAAGEPLLDGEPMYEKREATT